MAVNQSGFGKNRLTGGELGFFHFVIESRPSRVRSRRRTPVTTVLFGDVVDELHDENGLANASAAKQTNLSTTAVRRQKVDDLDARLKHLDVDRLVDELWWGAVNRESLFGVHWTRFVDQLTDNVQDTAKNLLADGHLDGRAGVLDRHAANQSIGRVHGDTADGAFAKVLGNLDNQVVGVSSMALLDRVRAVPDFGKLTGKLHVHNGADNLYDVPWLLLCVSDIL